MKTVTENQVGKVYSQKNSGAIRSELCMGCGGKLSTKENGYHKECDTPDMWK